MSKVFVTQIPTRFDHETKIRVPIVDIAPASLHGDLIIMMPAGANFFATADMTDALEKHLQNYNFDEGDCLLALGNWNIFSAAAAILGRIKGCYATLTWDRDTKNYHKSIIDVRRYAIGK